MAYVVAEISCSPNGEERFPVPTTIRICRIFADAADAAAEFESDKLFKAESEFSGQDVYYVLWKLDTQLNLDRSIVQENVISNCGMWLPQNSRIYNEVADLEVEIVPPERVKQRAKQRAAAERALRSATAGAATTGEKKSRSKKAIFNDYNDLASNLEDGGGDGGGGDGGGGGGTHQGPRGGTAKTLGRRTGGGNTWNKIP